MRRPTSTRSIPTRSRSATRSTRSTGASTGSGRRCAARSSAWAGAPRRAFITYDWAGYNEAMLVVLLALGSPTHPVGESAWSAWSESYRHAWGRFMGYEHLSFAPLFGHQYSHVWIDFRGIQDAYDAPARHRLLREHAPRGLRAARLRDRESEGLVRIRRQRLGLHRVRRPRQAARRSTAANRVRYFLDYSARGAGRYGTRRRRHHRARPPRCRRCRSRPRS